MPRWPSVLACSISELQRYSELQRQKFHEWTDRHYREEGFDPDTAEAAGEALCREREATTDAHARLGWERLAALVRGGKS